MTAQEPFRVATFRAPVGRDAVPRVIPEGAIDVEIITGGRGWFELGGAWLEAVRGTVLWHHAGQQTIYKSDRQSPYECTFVRFAWDGEPDGIPRFSRWRDPVACQAFADEILSAFHGDSPDWEGLAGYTWHVLRWHAIRWAETAKESEFPPAVQNARSAIERRFGENLALVDLAAEAGLSVPHLHALFRKHTGETPHQALMNRRIAEARRLLVATRLPIKEVAWTIGYPEVSTFCRVFRRRCGVSPARYRQQYDH